MPTREAGQPFKDSGECLEIVTTFYRHLDRGEFAQLDALMSRDGIYHRPNGRAVPAGAELLTALSSRTATVTMAHLLTNLYSVREGPENMTVHGYMSVFIHDDGHTREGPAPMPPPSECLDASAAGTLFSHRSPHSSRALPGLCSGAEVVQK